MGVGCIDLNCIRCLAIQESLELKGKKDHIKHSKLILSPPLLIAGGAPHTIRFDQPLIGFHTTWVRAHKTRLGNLSVWNLSVNWYTSLFS